MCMMSFNYDVALYYTYKRICSAIAIATTLCYMDDVSYLFVINLIELKYILLFGIFGVMIMVLFSG